MSMAIDTPGQHQQPLGVNHTRISTSDEVAPDGVDLTVHHAALADLATKLSVLAISCFY